MKTGEVKKGQISQSGIMRCAAGLLCLGKTDYADVERSGKTVFSGRRLIWRKSL